MVTTVVEADHDGAPLRVFHRSGVYAWTHLMDSKGERECGCRMPVAGPESDGEVIDTLVSRKAEGDA